SSLPALRVADPTSKLGWMGNDAATGAAYGAAHEAGAGEGWQDSLIGMLTGAGAGAAAGAAVGKLTSRLRPQDADEIRAIQNAEEAGVRINRAIASPDPGVQQRAGLLSKMPYVGERLQRGINEVAVGDVEKGIGEVASGYRAVGTGP